MGWNFGRQASQKTGKFNSALRDSCGGDLKKNCQRSEVILRTSVKQCLNLEQ